MTQLNYFTEEGLKKLQDDLNHLKTVERPSISRQIAEARDKGDLSENAEYDAAKEAQAKEPPPTRAPPRKAAASFTPA